MIQVNGTIWGSVGTWFGPLVQFRTGLSFSRSVFRVLIAKYAAVFEVNFECCPVDWIWSGKSVNTGLEYWTDLNIPNLNRMILSNLTSRLYMAQTKTHARSTTLPSGDLEGVLWVSWKGCLWKYYTWMYYVHYTHTENAYFPTPYTDNQLLCEADSRL